MSILRMEGFAHFTTGAEWAAKGHSASGVNMNFHPTAGRGGRGRAYIGLNAFASVLLPAYRSTLFDHRAFWTPSLTTLCLMRTANLNSAQILVFGRADGSLEVMRADAFWGTASPLVITGAVSLGYTDPGLWRGSAWHQLQSKVVHHASAGEVLLKLDGIEVLNLTGVSTFNGNGTAAVVSSMLPFEFTGGSYAYCSDLVICDDQGTKYNDFLGDVAVYEDVNPTDGDLLEWVRSSGAGTWSSHVNQNPKDDDTTYLRSENSAERVSFFFPSIASSVGTVLAIKETVAHRKEEPAYGVVRLFARSDDDVNHDGPLEPSVETYVFDERIHETDPKDGSDWTVDKVNATQLGVENAT